MIKKILVSQPEPSSEKSPYFDIAKEYGVELERIPSAENFAARLFGCCVHIAPRYRQLL